MRSELLRLLCIAATLAGGLLSQNVTVPAAMAGVEGGGGSNIPFGSNLACRYQCVYDAAELPWSGPRLINGISLRANNGSPLAVGTAIAAKGYLDVSVLMSTTHRTSATASGSFEENYGEDRTWVLSLARIQLPAQPLLTAVGPRPANINLTFTTPWFFGLTPARLNQPAPTNLLVEIWIHAQPAGAYPLDNLGGCVAVASDFGQQGPACTVPPGSGPAAPGGRPTLATSTSMQAGGSFTWTLTNGPANAPFLVAVNLTNQGGLYGQAALPLPYPLFDPANPSLPPPGIPALRWPAPDCWFNLDPVATVFSVADASGTGNITTMMPAGRQYVGLTLFGQAIVYSQMANPLQIVTTMGRQSTICGPLGVARIYAFYNGTGNPAPPPPTSGAAQYGQGMVFEVR